MRSRLRKLHIDDLEYTWTAQIRAAPGPDGRQHRCIRIRVWGAGRTSCALQADLIVRRQRATAEDEYPYPGAADVRALIEHGLRAGWIPQSRGGTFQVTSAAGLALPAFVVTDLLWAGEQRP
ncbi:integrase [Dactylosporangium sp. NPDC000521]|uniref:integrase n=1 Tax=Dactylosporangium sp. NPDC000521 TaxID=3363975 RepID=UPI0036A4B314